jgi:hypothetical protein
MTQNKQRCWGEDLAVTKRFIQGCDTMYPDTRPQLFEERTASIFRVKKQYISNYQESS